MPSPVQMRAFVVGRNIWPLPPVARITFFASNSSIEPSRMFRVTAPTQLPWASSASEVVNHSS